jgi:crotonobetainyl-CoA:carnitine CoA-transferase CaiB-like acyl-CoA transferase
MVVAGNDRLFARLCEAVGTPRLADDPRFTTNPLRVAHRDELIPLLEQATTAHTTADLLARLRAAGVPASAVHDLAEVAGHEQLHALGILQEVAGRQLVSPPLTADGERVRYRSEPPLLGEHTAEVLAEAGYSAAEVAALEEAGVVRVGTPPAR